MQNEIVKVNFDTQTVSARELHEQLHIGTEFAKWFSRMCEYGFSTGNDYSEVIVKNDENLKGGRPATDYNISVDMAKQICMIQRTPEGKAVRQYLIDLEKAWNTPEQVMARALKIANQSIENLKTQNIALVADNDRMRPKEIFAENKCQHDGCNDFKSVFHGIFPILSKHPNRASHPIGTNLHVQMSLCCYAASKKSDADT